MTLTNIFTTFCLDNDQLYTYLDEFKYYLTESESVLIGHIDKNIRRYFCASGIKQHNGKEAVTIQSVFKYCFNNVDKITKCKLLTSIIIKELFKDTFKHNKNKFQTTLDLYKKIKDAKFCGNLVFIENLNFETEKILTLINEHRDYFSDSDWKKICWFEWHVSKELSDSFHEINYEDLLKLKFEKFDTYFNFYKCSKQLQAASNKQLNEKTNRLENRNTSQSTHIHAKTLHLPFIIDNELKYLFDEIIDGNIVRAICFDTVCSLEENCIEIVAALLPESHIPDSIETVCTSIASSIARKHGVNVRAIYFIPENFLSDYVIDDDQTVAVLRLELRDAIENNEIKEILFTWKKNIFCNISASSSPEEHLCNTCIQHHNTNPLQLQNFNLLNEWYLETPIEIQIIFESFINRKCLRKTSNLQQYLKDKLQRLYIIFDTVLNLKNKNYFGPFQLKSSNKLLIDYKSINSVFDITSSLGSTASLSTAERKLKLNANPDTCYYNTFIKRYKQPYTTCQGTQQDYTYLRNCHIILMLDNLVRLRYTADPNPGEGRAKQICTLPITIQGLPLDSHVTKDWHRIDCDGNGNCLCKQKEKLTEVDIGRVLLEEDEQQKNVATNFSNLMTWGNVPLWRDLPDELLAFVEDYDSTKSLKVVGDYGIVQQVEEQSENLSDDDEDLITMLDILENAEQVPTPGEDDHSDNSDISSDIEDFDISNLETTVNDMSILDNENDDDTVQSAIELLSSFGFKKFIVPKLLCRHPPPAIGRDDDLSKLAEILNDVLKKMGYLSDPEKMVNRILCGPDHKIGANLLTLVEQDNKYECFLPEFPLLHLRKSKITILFSAYKDAGLIQLFKFMKDEDQDDWAKLISIQHINFATRFVRRLAIAMHLAFMIKFSSSLDNEHLPVFLYDMENESTANISEKWSEKFENFLNLWSSRNATFAMHRDIMQQCDNIVAVSLSERLGGPTGYSLLLSAVKRSLLFSFLNNASAYAPYCAKMLYHHYSAGHFHRCMKETLYTTPIKNSHTNFATDTKREMDHLDALKGFRSGSNTSSISCRMSLIDHLNDMEPPTPGTQLCDSLGWELSETDKKHIFPTVNLILEKNGIDLIESPFPYNVYAKSPVLLPPEILNDISIGVGKYLVYKYCAKTKMFQMNESSVPSIEHFRGPKELLQRALKSKGVTMRRIKKSNVKMVLTVRQKKEEERKKIVARETAFIECFSSENNCCQALVKPDSSKPRVMKSLGIQKALKEVLSASFPVTANKKEKDDILKKSMNLNLHSIPTDVFTSIRMWLFEFAGVKFKVGNVKSGKEYLNYINSFLGSFLRDSHATTSVVCEEKYNFTPDAFKAITRQQRNTSSTTGSNIDHLKSGENVLSLTTYNKDFLTKTQAGKQRLSQFLCENIKHVNLDKDMTLIIDSDYYMSSEKSYAIPIVYERCSSENKVEFLHNIKQRKGEAEMAIVDWLIHYKNLISNDESVASVITSGDIDAVYIHMYCVSKLWPRKPDGSFSSQVYTCLQKPNKKWDIYNITFMLEHLEKSSLDKMFGMKLAVVLCIGGNDFIPKFHQISHSTVMKEFLYTPCFKYDLFDTTSGELVLNETTFTEFVKSVYCPKKYKTLNLSYENVRALSIGKTADQSVRNGWKTKDPRKWLPPKSCIQRLADLVCFQIEYMNSAGEHDAPLPDISMCRCLKQSSTGEVEYDFGPEASFELIEDLPTYTPAEKRNKRRIDYTPQKGTRKKRPATSTPKSHRK